MMLKLRKYSYLIRAIKCYQILSILLLVLFNSASQAEVVNCKDQHNKYFLADDSPLHSDAGKIKHKLSSKINYTIELDINSIRKSYCTQEKFNRFLLKFSNDVSFQKIFTHIPLQKSFIQVDASPEPKQKETLLDKSRIYFPIYPHPEEMERLNLAIDIFQDNKKAKVTLKQENTDYLVSFFFEFSNCWYLIRVEDWSL